MLRPLQRTEGIHGVQRDADSIRSDCFNDFHQRPRGKTVVILQRDPHVRGHQCRRLPQPINDLPGSRLVPVTVNHQAKKVAAQLIGHADARGSLFVQKTARSNFDLKVPPLVNPAGHRHEVIPFQGHVLTQLHYLHAQFLRPLAQVHRRHPPRRHLPGNAAGPSVSVAADAEFHIVRCPPFRVSEAKVSDTLLKGGHRTA